MILKTILLLCVMGYATVSKIEKKLNCNFNDEGSFCRWNDDPRDKTAVWESLNYGPIIGDAACMRPVKSKLSSNNKHSARLWSSWLNLENDKKKGICLKFIYRIEMNSFDIQDNSSPVVLSLLKHSDGACRLRKLGDSKFQTMACDSAEIWSSGGKGNGNWDQVHVSITIDNDFKIL